jgi:GrpB-like predicted nucleotidyltransferase (UPF0157 family)
MPAPVIVVDYDLQWPEQFESIRRPVATALGPLASTIEHVGSTSVSNLAAKPIIDLDVLLRSAADLPAAIDRLAQLGYIHQGDLGIPEREAFLTPPHAIRHNLYICPPQSREFQRHITFRNYLRTHPEAVQQYGDLKKSLAAQFRDDRDAYLAGKTDFITAILNQCTSPR